jgi:hypothetical protein
MSIFDSRKKLKSKKRALSKEEFSGSSYNSPEENSLLLEIENSQIYAEGGVRPDVETYWSDEYKMYQGGGKQWDTSKGLRSSKGKKRNFNSEDNFILPMIENMKSPFSSSPQSEITGMEKEDDESAEKIDDIVPFILERNKFPEQWDKIVDQTIKYGPVIGYVPWDQHWIGGNGPNRWVGEVRTLFVKKSEFFPDPAIIDLEERLQECSYVNLKKRKKLQWFKEKWPTKGEYIIADNTDIVEGQEEEGQDPQQATLIIHFHKGTPEYVTDEWKETFLQQAEQAEQAGDSYKAQDYRDMAEGTLKGVHCAYKAGSILLDYVPYIYDDGLYPFVYKVLYMDEEQPYGMGEIRNTHIPQILHNKADEIELGAMLGQGLGGGWFNKGAISEGQKRELLDNIAKANSWIEVNDINGIQQKTPAQIPAYITNYKDGKKTVMDTVTGNTAILQGQSVGANVPYSTIAELGARADARMKHKAKIFERFMKEFVQLIINRVVQFYTVDRKYRILGEEKQVTKIRDAAFKTLTEIANMPPGTPPQEQMQAMVDLLMFTKQQIQAPRTKTFNRSMLIKEWERETIINEDGSITTKKETFIPEFDIKVRVTDERPTDRNYWSKIVTDAISAGLIGPKTYWRTIIDGKIPTLDEIMEELEELKQAQAEAAQAQIQAEQQAEAAKMQVGMEKQRLQNESVEKQVGLKAAIDLAKAGKAAENARNKTKQ